MLSLAIFEEKIVSFLPEVDCDSVVPLTLDSIVLVRWSVGDSPFVTESVEDTAFLEVWLAGCEFSPGLAAVDTALACVRVLTPPERSPIPTGSAVLKKRVFTPGLALRTLIDLGAP